MTNAKKSSIIIELTNQWPVGQAAKTSASHAENMGSIPVPVTIEKRIPSGIRFFYSMATRYVGIEPSAHCKFCKSQPCPHLSSKPAPSALWVRITASPSPVETSQGGANSRTKSRWARCPRDFSIPQKFGYPFFLFFGARYVGIEPSAHCKFCRL